MLFDWGYTSYGRAHWAHENEQKLYIGRFAYINADLSGGKANIIFWARRPTAALREICERLKAAGDNWEATANNLEHASIN